MTDWLTVLRRWRDRTHPSGPDTSNTLLVLAVVLVIALIGVVPVLSHHVGVEPFLLIWMVGMAYSVVVLLLDRALGGLCVAAIVTTTMATRVRVSSIGYLQTVPGDLGPSIWLVYLPLGLLALVLFRRIPVGSADDLLAIEAVFGGYVVWSSLSTVLGNPARTDTAFWYTLLISQGWLLFVAVRRGAHNGWIRFETVASVLTVAVLGHAVFGAAQLLNQGVFGLRTLGEISRGASNPDAIAMAFPVVGEFNVGQFVSGLTGNPYVLAALLVLTLPVVLVWMVRTRSPVYWVLSAVAFGLGVVTLRATRSDGARGGLIFALIGFGGLFMGLKAIHALSGFPSSLSTVRSDGGQRRRLARAAVDGAASRVRGILSGVVFLVGLSFVAFTDHYRVDGRTVGAGSGGSAPGPLSTLGPRLEQYEVALGLVPDNALFGIGGGNFQYVASQYGVPEGTALHSAHLIPLVETGIPGFVMYAAVLLLVFWRSARLLLRRTSHPDPLFVAAVLAGLCGYLAFATFDHLMLDRPMAFFPFCVVSGALVGADSGRTDPDQGSRPTSESDEDSRRGSRSTEERP